MVRRVSAMNVDRKQVRVNMINRKAAVSEGQPEATVRVAFGTKGPQFGSGCLGSRILQGDALLGRWQSSSCQ